MEELLREVLHEITAEPARFVAEVVQSAVLLAVLAWAGRKALRRRLAARRERIAADLASADAAEQESVRLREEGQAVAARAAQEPGAILQAAQERAAQERAAATNRIEAETREIVAGARQRVEEDKQRIRREASARLIRLTTETARRYLEEMLSEAERRALTQKAILETLEEIVPESLPQNIGAV